MEESLKVHWVAENLVNKESENVKEETICDTEETSSLKVIIPKIIRNQRS